MEPILHITTRKQWEEAKRSGHYQGDTLATEGFIHCSTAQQVVGVANVLFKGGSDLVLLVIDPSQVQPEIKWEGQEGGALFPHIYGPLDCVAMIEALPFDLGANGLFELPAKFMPSPASFVIRPATEHDAEQLIAFVQALAAEPNNNILHEPGTFNPTVEWERDFLRGIAATDNSVFLVAVEDGAIIGNVNASGGKRPAVRHAASIGIAVAQDYRGKGVGTALMQAVIGWASGTGIIRRLELEVFARNEGAIRLYERFGFVIEGRKKASIFKGGAYIDDLVMGKLLF